MKCDHEFGANLKLNKDKYIEYILSKGVKLACPRCSSFDHEVVGEGMIKLKIYAIPIIMLACSKCYYIMQHATINECFHEKD